jgi:hypothetical protein
MKALGQRVEALERSIDFKAMTDAELNAWIAADTAKHPQEWQMLRSLSDEELERIVNGDGK